MPSATHPELGEFLRQLPKTETHLHLEGALPWTLIHELDPGRFPNPPESWKDHYRFPDFAAFETELLDMACAWFTSPDRYHLAARQIFSKLHREENVHYLETSFASGMIEYLGLDGKAVCESIRAAVPPGMTVRIFMGIHHNGYTPKSRGFIEDCLGWDDLDGIDLHGTETIPLEPWTKDLWKRARDAGKVTKAHAGEFDGPDFIERVVDELGVRRIQHGVRAIESPAMMNRLRDLGAILDICPISNVKLQVVESMDQHPVRAFMKAGITCTISTDDPVSFGNTLSGEYIALHEDLGMPCSELAELAINGFRNALVEGDLFADQIKEINDLAAAYS